MSASQSPGDLLQAAGIFDFLKTPTPQTWLERAVEQLDLLLIDHANCERKAAETAMALIYRYPEQHEVLLKMSKLAREELHHFEQVLEIMQRRKVNYEKLSAARYASELRKQIRTYEPAALVDKLIIGAYIEARSCERFAALAPLLEPELAKFYTSLLRSEARHFQDYLGLASKLTNENIEPRINLIGEIEAELITGPDDQFRFHSGVPV